MGRGFLVKLLLLAAAVGIVAYVGVSYHDAAERKRLRIAADVRYLADASHLNGALVAFGVPCSIDTGPLKRALAARIAIEPFSEAQKQSIAASYDQGAKDWPKPSASQSERATECDLLRYQVTRTVSHLESSDDLPSGLTVD